MQTTLGPSHVGSSPSPSPQARRSGCAARSRANELERLRRMTVEARIKSALTMGARFSWLKPAALDQ